MVERSSSEKGGEIKKKRDLMVDHLREREEKVM